MASQKSYDDAVVRLATVTEEFKGATDRATAIVAGAFLDDALGSLLQSFMVIDAGSDDALFANNGPLSTFSAKILLAFRLGIISARERSDLEVVRKIRNRFAHEVSLNSFTDQSTRDLCRNMETPIEMLSVDMNGILLTTPENLQKAKAPKDNVKAIFQQAVLHLMVKLTGRLATAIKSRRKPAIEFEKAHEPDEALLTLAQAQQVEVVRLHTRLTELGNPAPVDHMQAYTFETISRSMIKRIEMLKAAHVQLKLVVPAAI